MEQIRERVFAYISKSWWNKFTAIMVLFMVSKLFSVIKSERLSEHAIHGIIILTFLLAASWFHNKVEDEKQKRPQ